MEFVLNPRNGYWGLAESGCSKDCLLKKLEELPSPIPVYKGVQVIALNTTTSCNLDCVYCSTVEIRGNEKMPLAVAKKVVDSARELSYRPSLLFHGSEPLLNFPLIEETLKYEQETCPLGSRNLEFFVQTNLTMLKDRMINFFRKNNIAISTSLDGLENHHNLNRPYRNGQGSYSSVMDGIKKVLEYQEGLCGVCVITKDNVDSLSEIALDFEKRGLTEVQFLPAIPSSGNFSFVASNEELSREYIRLFEQTIDRIELDKQKISVKCLSQYLADIFFNTGITSCRVCTPSPFHPLLAVDTDGGVYPCDLFWGDKEKKVGSILEEGFTSMLNKTGSSRSCSLEKTLCGSCDWKTICGGGCLGDRTFSSNGKPYYCETHKSIFEYLSKRIPILLKKGTIKKIFDKERQSGALSS